RHSRQSRCEHRGHRKGGNCLQGWHRLRLRQADRFSAGTGGTALEKPSFPPGLLLSNHSATPWTSEWLGSGGLIPKRRAKTDVSGDSDRLSRADLPKETQCSPGGGTACRVLPPSKLHGHGRGPKIRGGCGGWLKSKLSSMSLA